MSSSSPHAAKRGIKPRFTRDEVLAAAVELFDSEPAEAFTMRRLAEHLGMGVMTLYGYVASKDELLEGVAALLFDELGRGDASDAPWEEQLREQASGIHAIVVRHPHLGQALRAHGAANPSLFRVRERMLAVLQGAGFAPAAAIEAMGVISGYAEGFAAVQAATIEHKLLPRRVRELPQDEFPLLYESADIYASHSSDAAFRRGLDLLIAGLRADLEG